MSGSGVCILLLAVLGCDGAARAASVLISPARVLAALTEEVCVPRGRLLLPRDRLQSANRHVGKGPATAGGFMGDGARLRSVPCNVSLINL